jgi:hypothetical protein
MGRHYLLQREKKSGREQSKLDILAVIVREEGGESNEYESV